MLVDELQAVAVSRQDGAVPPGLLAQTADRAEYIVRLPALAGIDRDVHRGEHLLHDRHLHGKLLRHGVARSLVAVIAQMAERRRVQVKGHAQRVRFFPRCAPFPEYSESRRSHWYKVRPGRQRPHAVKRAVDDAVPVQDHQLHMVSPSIRCASTLCALRRIDDLDAACLQLIADAVGLRPVLRALCFGTGGDERVDLRVVLLLRRALRAFSAAESRFRPSTSSKLARAASCGIVRLCLQHIIDGRHGERRVEVGVQRTEEALLQRLEGLRVDRAVLRAQGRDAGDELL